MVSFQIALLLGLVASPSEAFVPVPQGGPGSFFLPGATRKSNHDKRRLAVNVAASGLHQQPSNENDDAGLRAVISNVTLAAMESLSMEGDVDEEALKQKRMQLAARQLQAGKYRVQLDLAAPLGLCLAQVKRGRKISNRELDLDQIVGQEYQKQQQTSENGKATDGISLPRQSMDWPTMVGRMDADFTGLLVSSVIQGGRAWDAGIRAGDILTAVPATVGEALWPTTTLEGVQSAFRSRKMLSQKAVVEFLRLADQVDNVYELTLEKPLGLEVQETTDGFVVVTGFTEKAPNLVRYAVRVGDRITAVDSSWGDQMWPVSTVEGLVSACTSRFPKTTVRLRLERPIENLDLAAPEVTETAPTQTVVESTSVAVITPTSKSSVEQKQLLKRCRDILKRYSPDSKDKVESVNGFKGKYDVPAIVADKVVDTLASERVTLDSVTLSMLMSAYLSCNQPESALRVFEGAVGFRADGSPLPPMESLIGRNGGGFVPSESALNLQVGTAVMQAHAQRGDMLSVSRVLAALEGRSGVLVGGIESAPWPFTGVFGSIQIDTQCYNVAIAGAEKVGGEEALEMGLVLFDQMSDPQQVKTSADRIPIRDVVTYNTMISVLCNAGRFDQAFRLFDQMRRSGIRPDKYTYTSLIKACSTDGDIQELLYDMRERGVQGDVKTYNTMIKLLCKERKLTEATKMVSEMEQKGISPDSMTYGLLMTAMLKADKATACLALFESACANEKTAPLTDNVYLYTTAITAASTLRNYERALELVTRMAAKGVKPNLKTLTAVVSACLFASKPDLAIKVFRKIEAPDGYALSQGLRAFCDNGNHAEALEIVKKQQRRQRLLSGKQIMLAYKRILESSLVEGDFAVARDALTDLLKKGFIPNKGTLHVILSALSVLNPRQMSALAPSEGTKATFEFLLFALDSLTARNLPIESSLYVSILSVGNLLGGRAKRISAQIAHSRASTDSTGTEILSTASGPNRQDKNDEDSWVGWQTVFKEEDVYGDNSFAKLPVPQIDVRVLPREVRFVLKAETGTAITKSRKRRSLAVAMSSQ